MNKKKKKSHTPTQKLHSNGAKNNGSSHKVRYAVVGLGYIAQKAVLPAFSHAKQAELVALISSDSTKLSLLSKNIKSLTQRTTIILKTAFKNHKQRPCTSLFLTLSTTNLRCVPLSLAFMFFAKHL